MPQSPVIQIDEKLTAGPKQELAQAPFHVMTKPIGPLCNLDCEYCFYLEKENLFAANERFKMSDEVLEGYIRNYIESQPEQNVTFAWQGGEPTLLGVKFFQKVVALQKKYAKGRNIENALQTNGTLLDENWCRFLHDENFLVGISIDGPEKLHNQFRVDKKKGPSYSQVIRGIELAKKFKVEFNTLTCVHAGNVDHPLEVYKFLKNIGSGYLQFIPIVERLPDEHSRDIGLQLAHPPDFRNPPIEKRPPVMAHWSVDAKKYGDFHCAIFDRWVTRDIGKTYVQIIDMALGKWLNIPGGLCVFAETCGRAMAIEHNGDVYTCDHYVYPRYKVGNVLNQSLGAIVESEPMKNFGEEKKSMLPQKCVKCDVRFACNGECPKHRFTWTSDGEYGLNYLCPAYMKFFRHIDPAMKIMAQLYQSGRPPAQIMELAKKDPSILKKRR
ncbi:anaerobic sulfatase maturase [Cerasicoccus arenae]|uniref:Anaerobic sulfatase maturase AslB n=1 Tax=Cerasicoccus arenae TaxID=424488 RepID=A0A8J3DAK6_9BACT|nr:anaerobic sulfatase maturase [Cerasicoccus arenae]MBK1858013.1 anaerobic sulfatase maturase [Cerasicoccus arenae]GHB97466.1 anaerobic sulfatase maturase AslB [Cerasicoccus arenae]